MRIISYLAVYMRLSIEDRNTYLNKDNDESNSISSQRKQIYQYINSDMELSSYEVIEFSDDGYSGTNMKRPAMQELLTGIKENKIGCIIVKDMSRFSRDYIEMGTYLNQIFPFMGIRFISINDRYDSINYDGKTAEIDTVFKTLLYDLYSKDISVKVKAAYANKCANGEYIFAMTPFGYMKSGEEKNAVVINEKEAEIVRYIFELAASGKGSTQIARQLYMENVPDIIRLRRPDKQYDDGKIHTWSDNAVRRILNNRFYLGEMIYGKKTKKVIKNHHEPLISKEMFVKASQVIAKNSNKPNDTDASRDMQDKIDVQNEKIPDKSPLIGKMYCGGCGYALAYRPVRGRNRYARFECTKHAVLQIPCCCTYLNADLLEKTVLFLLNYELKLRGNLIIERKNIFFDNCIQALKKQDLEYEAQIKKLQIKKDMVYEEYAAKRFEKENIYQEPCRQQFLEAEYKNTSESLKRQLENLLSNRRRIQQNLKKIEDECNKLRNSINENKNYFYIEQLTQDAADIFIKRIYAYKGKRIEIEWNFAAITSHKRGMGK